ncbi:hypothetical protein [Rhodococcus phenolicus]|uniref:hypothetical protein n=1 Tax=Rhodococcus phenolicus TaxID=263849 RepID=UPI0008325811|nr:hypothetical protein [Rhodococcus phenolicus]
MNTLEGLEDARTRRAALVAQIEAIDAEIRDLVQAGVAEGLTGGEMAEAAGLTKQRISQIKRGGRQ